MTGSSFAVSLPSITLTVLEGTLNLTFRGLFMKVLTLVVIVLARGQRQLELGPAVLEIDLQGHEREALFARLGKELHDFRLVHQEFPAAQRIVVEDIALIIGADMQVLDEKLAVLDARITVLEVGPSGAQGLDFRSLKGKASLKRFVYEVIVTGLAILADRLDSCILSSHRIT